MAPNQKVTSMAEKVLATIYTLSSLSGGPRISMTIPATLPA